MKKILKPKGFTLVEVLLVVVIIAILAAVVIAAINPGRQISQANNTQRSNDVRAILSAVHQYTIDNRGQFPPALAALAAADPADTAFHYIGNDPDYDGDDMIDLCDDLVSDYIGRLPADPNHSFEHGEEPETVTAYFDSCEEYDVEADEGGYWTGYRIKIDKRKITVDAPGTEDEDDNIELEM